MYAGRQAGTTSTQKPPTNKHRWHAPPVLSHHPPGPMPRASSVRRTPVPQPPSAGADGEPMRVPAWPEPSRAPYRSRRRQTSALS